jgi:NTP pyrophosphatase (non-canonical NTP hydrolase)
MTRGERDIILRENIFLEIHDERNRQDSLWGEQNHDPYYWLTILVEEVGEVAKALCEKKPDEYRYELVHTAAVAVSMIECYERQLHMEKINGKA